MDAVLSQVVVELDPIHRLELDLPASGEFLSRTLGRDTTRAVHAVEK